MGELRQAAKLAESQAGLKARNLIKTGSAMSGANNAREAELNEAQSKLDEGLKTCHAVIEDYRSLLSATAAKRNRNDNPKPE